MRDDDQHDSDQDDPAGLSIEPRITEIARYGFLGLFAYWSLTLVAPFAIILIWAGILSVSLYPLYSILRSLFGGRGRIAAFVTTALVLVIIVGPLAAIALDFSDAVQRLFVELQDGNVIVPAPADSVRRWPIVGEWVYRSWSQASLDLEQSLTRFSPYLLQAGGFLVRKVASFGLDLLSFVVSVIIAGFLFSHGPVLGERLKIVARRIAFARGARFVNLTAATIRNVARGVIGVAVLQGLLVGIIFVVFDVPAPGAFSFAVLVLCLVQIGPGPALLPAVIWAWTTQDASKALLLTLLLIPIMVLDNVIKPILVAKGLSTPTIVILAGVIGGTLSYGLIGLFLGPVVLGVFYDLVVAWSNSAEPGHEHRNFPRPDDRTVAK